MLQCKAVSCLYAPVSAYPPVDMLDNVVGPDCGGSTHFVRSNGGHGSEMMETVVDYMFRNLFPFQISCRSESSKLKLGRII